MKLLSNLDLSRNQLLNAVLQLLGAAPAGPTEGQVYHDSVLHKSRFYDGTGWVGMDGTDRSLDKHPAALADVDFGGFKAKNLAAPTVAGDATTKAYVDAIAVTGVEWKGPVRALSTVNVALATALIIDGYQTVVGDRVLLTGQAAAAQNGIWVVAAGAWTRPPDFAATSAQQNSAVFIEGGAVWANTGWLLSGQAAVTVDTTAETWIQFTGLGDVTVTAPIVKVGNNLSAPNVPTKFSATVGDGATTAISVAHNLNTKDVHVQIRDVATDVWEMCDWTATDANHVTCNFAVAPALASVRVVVIG